MRSHPGQGSTPSSASSNLDSPRPNLKQTLQKALEAFKCISIDRSDTLGEEYFALKLTLERARLWTWGLALSGTRESGVDARLQDPSFQLSLCRELNAVRALLEDSLQSYGFSLIRRRESPSRYPDGDKGTAVFLEQACNHFDLGLHHRSGRHNRTIGKWVFEGFHDDEAKSFFMALRNHINELYRLVQGPQMTGRADGILGYMVQRLTDYTTLRRLVEICDHEGYPSVSLAASTMMDIVSLGCDLHIDNDLWDYNPQARMQRHRSLDNSVNRNLAYIDSDARPSPRSVRIDDPHHRHFERDDCRSQSNASEDDRQTSKQTIKNARPTYFRIKYEHVDPVTLDYYELPWEWDQYKPGAMVVKEWLSPQFQETLFKHTKYLRVIQMGEEYNKVDEPLQSSLPKRDAIESVRFGEAQNPEPLIDHDMKLKAEECTELPKPAQPISQVHLLSSISGAESNQVSKDTGLAERVGSPAVMIDHE